MMMPERLREGVVGLFEGRGDGAAAAFFSPLAALFASLAGRADVTAAFPEFPALFGGIVEGLERGDPEEVEDRLTILYAYLHGAGSAYAPAERKELDASGGYWCHAGGLSPLRRAASDIAADTRLADYGAGNGFQGLLFQHLYPHRKTTLIEISGPMIERGRSLRKMMGIAPERIEWIHGSVADVPPRNFDFIYIYRPLRPEGEEGRRFYEGFAEDLSRVRHPVTIYSIADCLKDFLDDRFRITYDDGQLTCFAKGEEGIAPTPERE
jgi:hypothetical protein